MDELITVIIVVMKVSLVAGAALAIAMIFDIFKHIQISASKNFNTINMFGKFKKLVSNYSDEIIIYSLAAFVGACAGFLLSRYSEYLKGIIFLILAITIPLGIGMLTGFIIYRLRKRQAGYETLPR